MMLRLHYYSEWLYYGAWYLLAINVVFAIPHRVTHHSVGIGWRQHYELRQPWLWVVQQAWVFPYLHTLAERKAMSSNDQHQGRA